MANSAPLEVLDQIFFSLSIQTLKNVGLVCRSFHYAAERFMFREVLLLPNAESFAKLREISRHARLKDYVKSLVYSGEMLTRFEDYEHWRFNLNLSKGMLVKPLVENYEYRRVMDCGQFNEEELKQRYARYYFWFESQKRVQSNDNAKRWMSEPCRCCLTLPR